VRAEKEMAERVKSRLDELTSDQARIRENIAKVEKKSALYKRNIEKLSQWETEFEGFRRRRRKPRPRRKRLARRSMPTSRSSARERPGKMVGHVRFELTTPSTPCWCATRLR
jgi:hypothetical protein